MKTLFAVIGFLVAIVLSPVWYGYVLSITWGWYFVPTFHVPPLSIPAGIGIAAIVRFIANPNPESKDSDRDESAEKRVCKAVVKATMGPAVVLLFCWIVKFWM